MEEQSSFLDIAKTVPSAVGGSVRGLTVQYQPDLNTGTSRFSFPLAITPARALTPELALHYSSGLGNGVFGMGFDIPLLTIQRDTHRKVPCYDELDEFVLSTHGELIKVKFSAEPHYWQGGQHGYRVTHYRPRVDTYFAEIEFWQPLSEEISNDPGFWIIREPQGIIHFLGYPPNEKDNKNATVVQHPHKSGQGFAWSITHTEDALGNLICYEYVKDTFADDRDKDSHTVVSPSYLQAIRYGNYGANFFAFEVQFDYRDELSLPADRAPLKEDAITARPDPLYNHRPGFALKTRGRCQHIALYHHFEKDDYAKNCLTHYWQFTYEAAPFSFLTQLVSTGCRRGEKGDYFTTSYPPIEFGYTEWNQPDEKKKEKEALKFEKLVLENRTRPDFHGEFQLVDLYQEGLPGILYCEGQTALFWRSQGNGNFESPKPLTSFPLREGFDSSPPKLVRLGGSTQLALVVEEGNQSGFYRLQVDTHTKTEEEMHAVTWEPFQPFETHPILEGISLDISAQGQADWVVLTASQPHYFPGQGERGYRQALPLYVDDQSDFPVGRSDETQLLTFADVFGDGLLHRVQITEAGCYVWPNLGHGQFGMRQVLSIASYGEGANDAEEDEKELPVFNAHHIYLADTDQSGTADLIYAYSDRVCIFLNQGGRFASKPNVIFWPEGVKYTEYCQTIFSIVILFKMVIKSNVLTTTPCF